MGETSRVQARTNRGGHRPSPGAAHRKTDVFEALGWIERDGLHDRVDRIEQVLRKAGLLPDDELSVPGKIKSAVKVDHPVGDTAENVERPA